MRRRCACGCAQPSATALAWVNWFNYRRLLEPIGDIPPAEAEARYHAELEATALAA
jgi:putative transposase